MSLVVFAYKVEINGIYYDIHESTKTATVRTKYETGAGGGYSQTEIIIPSTITYGDVEYVVTEIAPKTFFADDNIVSIILPNTINSIGYEAFCGCSSLSAINIPYGITNINQGTFSGCSKLVSVIIPESVISIGDKAFYMCMKLKSINLPNGITTIGNDAFYYCYKLSEITIPTNLVSIGKGAFDNCAITSITLPEGLTSIGDRAFRFSDLTSIILPSTLKTIGSEVFYYCNSITSLSCKAIDIPQIGSDVFYKIPSHCLLYVPAQSLEKYKNAEQWKDFGAILPIEEYPTDIEENPLFNSNNSLQYKILRNGQLLIFRDGKTYTVMGQEL